MKKIIVIVSILFTVLSCSNKKETSTEMSQNSADIEVKISELLAKMTLKEKASQMLNIGLPTILTGDYWDERDSVVLMLKSLKNILLI